MCLKFEQNRRCGLTMRTKGSCVIEKGKSFSRTGIEPVTDGCQFALYSPPLYQLSYHELMLRPNHALQQYVSLSKNILNSQEEVCNKIYPHYHLLQWTTHVPEYSKMLCNNNFICIQHNIFTIYT